MDAYHYGEYMKNIYFSDFYYKIYWITNVFGLYYKPNASIIQ